MRNVTRSYEALRLRCLQCDHTWPAVYEVARWDGSDGHEEVHYAGTEAAVSWPWSEARCPSCGGPAVPQSPDGAVPVPRDVEE
jgi:hypothetical protein